MASTLSLLLIFFPYMLLVKDSPQSFRIGDDINGYKQPGLLQYKLCLMGSIVSSLLYRASIAEDTDKKINAKNKRPSENPHYTNILHQFPVRYLLSISIVCHHLYFCMVIRVFYIPGLLKKNNNTQKYALFCMERKSQFFKTD